MIKGGQLLGLDKFLNIIKIKINLEIPPCLHRVITRIITVASLEEVSILKKLIQSMEGGEDHRWEELLPWVEWQEDKIIIMLIQNNINQMSQEFLAQEVEPELVI